jgi:hypothetical protein
MTDTHSSKPGPRRIVYGISPSGAIALNGVELEAPELEAIRREALKNYSSAESPLVVMTAQALAMDGAEADAFVAVVRSTMDDVWAYARLSDSVGPEATESQLLAAYVGSDAGLSGMPGAAGMLAKMEAFESAKAAGPEAVAALMRSNLGGVPEEELDRVADDILEIVDETESSPELARVVSLLSAE